jgi:hypothetical protein
MQIVSKTQRELEQAQLEEGRDWLHSPQCGAVRLRCRGQVSAEGEFAGGYAEYASYKEVDKRLDYTSREDGRPALVMTLRRRSDFGGADEKRPRRGVVASRKYMTCGAVQRAPNGSCGRADLS